MRFLRGLSLRRKLSGIGMLSSLTALVSAMVAFLAYDAYTFRAAFVRRDDPLLGATVGAQLIVRVRARAIFPNCPRYIPTMTLTEPSIYAPRPGCEPVEPAWKGFDAFKDYVHPRQPTAKGETKQGVT